MGSPGSNTTALSQSSYGATWTGLGPEAHRHLPSRMQAPLPTLLLRIRITPTPTPESMGTKPASAERLDGMDEVVD